jgi:transcriptional regulator with GAF, ATPase, and Fis domain
MSEHYFFNRILGLVCSVFDAYSAVLFLPDGKGEYRLASYFSLGDNVLTNSALRPGQGLVGWILKNNEPLLLNAFDRQGDSLGYYSPEAESKIKAFMGCPLSQGYGALCLDSKNTYSFSGKDQKILHQFVQLIEALRDDIYQQRFNEQEQNYYTCLKLIRALKSKTPRWSAFLDHLLKLLNEYTQFSHTFFASRDERGEGFFLEGWNRPLFSSSENHKRKFNINSGMIGWVFRNHTPISTADKETTAEGTPVFDKRYKAPQFQSVICLPLVVHMRTRGVLVIADEGKRPITKELKNFLLIVADQLALFLENLYLKNKVHQLEER